MGIASSTVGLKMYAITAAVKKYHSIIKKMRKKHDKVVSLGKIKLDTIKVLIFKALIYLYTNHYELISVNNVLREYDEMKEEINNPQNTVGYII